MPKRALDGLLLGGGADIAPERYAQVGSPPSVFEVMGSLPPRNRMRVMLGYLLAPLIFVARYFGRARTVSRDRARDALESALLQRAMRAGVPVLGVCRGAQLMNVHCGGSLHADVSDFYTERPNPWSVLPSKPVSVRPDSALRGCLQVDTCWVNSLHHQAVAVLGDGITVVAREPTGVVQAIERPVHPFFIGVQWHPEYLPQRSEQRRLFRAFVQACAACDARISGARPAAHAAQS